MSSLTQNISLGNSGKAFKVADLNVQADADASGDDDDDGIDWEEG